MDGHRHVLGGGAHFDGEHSFGDELARAGTTDPHAEDRWLSGWMTSLVTPSVRGIAPHIAWTPARLRKVRCKEHSIDLTGAAFDDLKHPIWAGLDVPYKTRIHNRLHYAPTTGDEGRATCTRSCSRLRCSEDVAAPRRRLKHSGMSRGTARAGDRGESHAPAVAAGNSATNKTGKATRPSQLNKGSRRQVSRPVRSHGHWLITASKEANMKVFVHKARSYHSVRRRSHGCSAVKSDGRRVS
jgi:hypothetical protein